MLTCQKALFDLPDGLHYLNCAYMSPLAAPVEAAGLAGMRRKRNPALVTPDDFFGDSERLRAAFAGIIGAPDPSRVAIIPSVSYGIATAARNLHIGPDANLVVLHEQFPSNVYTWRRAAQQAGAELRVVEPPSGPGRGAAWNRRLLEAIDAKTAVVALPHVHWADGTVFDLAAVSARARDVGAALIVDGTQSVGAFPFDVGIHRPDALICAGYKWLMGPYSIGLAWYGERFYGGTPLEENWISRRDSRQFARLVDYQPEYAEGAARYDVGERSNFILVPMLLAALDLIATWGPKHIQAYCRRLSDPVLAEARELGFGVEEAPHRAGHLFGLRAPGGVSAEALRSRLEERNIRVSVRGDAVRIAPNVYNDEDDLAALAEALRSVVRISGGAGTSLA